MVELIASIRTLSPLHCGSGSGLKDIDMPVIRHKVSGHPLIPGSSIKGVLKDYYQDKFGKSDEKVQALFGLDSENTTNETEPKKANGFASAISMGDGLLLALPVRSFYGTFAYLASPYTLQQFKSALTRAGINGLPEIPSGLGIKKEDENYKVVLTVDSLLKIIGEKKILLEEMDLEIIQEPSPEPAADKWATIIADYFCTDAEDTELFKMRFAITDDNVLNFLCDTGLPIEAHIRINEETGTVDNGALWYEETVPPETLFFSKISVDRSFKKGTDKSAEDLSKILYTKDANSSVYTQFGGKATTGKGFVSVKYFKEEAKKNEN